MYCPRCAKPALPEHNYCRSCGFNLKPVSELVTGGPSASESSEFKAESLQSRQARVKRSPWITVVFGPMLLGLVIALLFGLVVRGLRGFPIWTAISLVIGLVVALVFILQVTQFPRNIRASRLTQPAKNLPPSATTTKLSQEDRSEQYSSVTEHTTELLGHSSPQAMARDDEPETG
jgi:predicted lipid-binding transport protein (Tim44 family)